jgi:hypothetical protein
MTEEVPYGNWNQILARKIENQCNKQLYGSWKVVLLYSNLKAMQKLTVDS